MRFGVLRVVCVVGVVLGLGGAGCGGATSLPSPSDTGGNGGGASSGGSGNGGGASDSLCDTYCDAAIKDCAGSVAVYANRDVCLQVCAALPVGKSGDKSGNTVQCRLSVLRTIEQTGEAAVQCPAAGPGGNGICGTNCEGLCRIAKDACPNDKFSTVCPSECAGLSDTGGYDVSQQSGYTVQCRLYHASAATVDPGIHCPHVSGIGPCAPVPL